MALAASAKAGILPEIALYASLLVEAHVAGEERTGEELATSVRAR